MRLKNITLKNFRCFEHLEIDLHRQMTVLVSKNGGGKTAVLDAIGVMLGAYLRAFDDARDRRFRAEDIRRVKIRPDTRSHEMEMAAAGVYVGAEGHFYNEQRPDQDGNPWAGSREMKGEKSSTTTQDAAALYKYGKNLQQQVRTPGETAILPLVALYDTGRLWRKPPPNKADESTSRMVAYEGAMESGFRYHQLARWIKYWTLNSINERMLSEEGKPYVSTTEFFDYLGSVNRAVQICLELTGWTGLHYWLPEDRLVAVHATHGRLGIDQMSDGIRAMIAMVADIAFRATKLNPHWGSMASQWTPGIVLIDEVDMHLHPEWQQVVLQALMEAFPRMQFVVTTHSPQVLSTIRRENIRVLGADTDGHLVAAQPLAMTYGEPSGDVMHSVMFVDPQPPVQEKADLQRLTELVDQGLYQEPEAVELLERLTAALGEQHPQLQRLHRSHLRQEALRR
jgi:predicted ATP-binding protein involved in virulence